MKMKKGRRVPNCVPKNEDAPVNEVGRVPNCVPKNEDAAVVTLQV